MGGRKHGGVAKLRAGAHTRGTFNAVAENRRHSSECPISGGGGRMCDRAEHWPKTRPIVAFERNQRARNKNNWR